jgi:hypothetical protein
MAYQTIRADGQRIEFYDVGPGRWSPLAQRWDGATSDWSDRRSYWQLSFTVRQEDGDDEGGEPTEKQVIDAYEARLMAELQRTQHKPL